MHPIFKFNDEFLPIKATFIPHEGAHFKVHDTTYVVNKISYEVTDDLEMVPIVNCRKYATGFSLTRR